MLLIIPAYHYFDKQIYSFVNIYHRFSPWFHWFPEKLTIHFSLMLMFIVFIAFSLSLWSLRLSTLWAISLWNFALSRNFGFFFWLIDSLTLNHTLRGSQMVHHELWEEQCLFFQFGWELLCSLIVNFNFNIINMLLEDLISY
jgi:hypothetical protein